jgi:flagellar assembly protein FliH
LSHRVDNAVTILPWQFPELGTAPHPPTALLPAETDPGDDIIVEPEPHASGSDEHLINEIVEDRLAARYAEGFDRGLSEGREKGYAAGFEEGTKAAQIAAAEEANRLARIVARLAAPIPALERTVEEAVVALALEVARCIIVSEISFSRDYLLRLIREAMAKVPIEMGPLQVVLNPADLRLIRALSPEIDNSAAALVGDEAVEAGGCLVIAGGQSLPLKDMRWQQRNGDGMSQVDLTLASRWRSVMLTLFEGEDK